MVGLCNFRLTQISKSLTPVGELDQHCALQLATPPKAVGASQALAAHAAPVRSAATSRGAAAAKGSQRGELPVAAGGLDKAWQGVVSHLNRSSPGKVVQEEKRMQKRKNWDRLLACLPSTSTTKLHDGAKEREEVKRFESPMNHDDVGYLHPSRNKFATADFFGSPPQSPRALEPVLFCISLQLL